MCISFLRQESLDRLPDRVLMEKTCAGNEAAFEVLVRRYQDILLRFAARRVDIELARDVMQHVWMQFYLALPGLLQKCSPTHGDGSLKSWLFCITRNRCIDEIRRRRRRAHLFCELGSACEDDESTLLDELLDTAPLPEEQVEQHNEQTKLCNAIETLPPKYRVIVWLRYTQDLSFNEIGNRLHMPPNTVKTYFHRARPLLCAALAERASA